LLAGVIMIVSIGALTLTVCRALLMLLFGAPSRADMLSVAIEVG